MSHTIKQAYVLAMAGIRNSETGVDHERCLRMLVEHLGVTHARRSTLKAITAVLTQEAFPGRFQNDEEAWDAHGASRTNFKVYKKRLRNKLKEDVSL